MSPEIRPLNELNHLTRATNLQIQGKLDYYNVTESGLEQKSALGCAWVWISRLFYSLMGWPQSIVNYIKAVNMYLERIPQDEQEFKSRFKASGFENLEKIQDIKDLAQTIIGFDTLRPKGEMLKALTVSIEEDILHQQQCMIDDLASIKITVPIPEGILAIDDPFEQFIALLPPSKRDRTVLLAQFNKDIHRQGIFIENESLDGIPATFEELSFNSTLYPSQSADTKEKLFASQIHSRIEDCVKRGNPLEKEILDNPANYDPDEVLKAQEKINNLRDIIKSFSTQSVGNYLLQTNPNYPGIFEHANVFDVLFNIEDPNEEEEKWGRTPLTAKLDPFIKLTKDANEITYGGTWSIWEGASDTPVVATVKSSMTINFEKKTLEIDLIKDFSITETCTFKQLQRLHERFSPLMQ
jgi:hypothetical protein